MMRHTINIIADCVITYLRGLLLLPGLIVVILLFPVHSFSQGSATPWLKLEGNTEFAYHYQSAGSPFQDYPASYFTWNFKNSILIKGLPVTAGFYYTSLSDGNKQDITNFFFRISLKDWVNKGNRNKPAFLNYFPVLELGTCRPVYTSYTLSGIPVRGLNIEFTPGNTFLAFTSGIVRNQVSGGSSVMSPFEKRITAGRFGFGKKDQDHLFFQFVHVKESGNSVEVIQDSLITFKPAANLVAGAELSLFFLKKRIFIKGEYAASVITENLEAPAQQDLVMKLFDLIDADKIFKVNLSTHLDHAWKGTAGFVLPMTKLEIKAERIGPGYRSLGVPYLRNDKLQYEGKYTQYFAKKKISFQAYFRKNNDNLINWKPYTTEMIAFGGILTLRLKKLPYLIVLYSPVTQKNNMQENTLRNKASLFSVNTGYQYRMRKTRCNTALSFSFNNNRNERDSLLFDFISSQIGLNQSWSFTFPLSLFLNLQYRIIDSDGEDAAQYGGKVRSTYIFRQKWKNSAGISYLYGSDNNGSTGISFESSYTFRKIGELFVKLENRLLEAPDGLLEEDHEMLLLTGVRIKW